MSSRGGAASLPVRHALRVSTDGGGTWQPSVQLNAVPMRGDVEEARHWTGLAAAADGRFHAAWIGDATGTRQVWTAAVVVGGAAVGR